MQEGAGARGGIFELWKRPLPLGLTDPDLRSGFGIWVVL